MANIALFGGKPVRDCKITYGKQHINKNDIRAVTEVLKSDWLTQGPKILEFESQICRFTGSKYAVTTTSGTTALHLACIAAEIGPGDEVITTPMSFAASANCVRYCGGTVVFADIDPHTYNIDPKEVKKKITKKTKAIIAVDYAGQSAHLEALRLLCDEYGLVFIEDAAHAIGSQFNGKMIGNIADLTTFSFHPVKTITGGEGGMVTTNHEKFASTMRLMASHGINKNAEELSRRDEGAWYYEQQFLGYNFRMTDIQAALLLNQLKRIDDFKKRRKEIVSAYNKAFARMDGIITPIEHPLADSCWHLYVIRVDTEILGCTRRLFFDALAAENVQPQVHYVPIHLHPNYQSLGHSSGECPIAEEIYESIITLPLYPAMNNKDLADVIEAVKKIHDYFLVRRNSK